MKMTLIITDLNDDCLAYIFESLNLSDLLNVADTTTKFGSVAKSIFKRKHAKTLVVAHRSSLTNGLRHLRNFGDLIQKLSVDFFSIKKNGQKMLEQYIIEYCSNGDSLKKMKLFFCRQNAFDGIEKPFRSVENVHFTSNLSKKLSHFNQWFPKMRYLKLINISAAKLKCIETNIPLLEYLEVFNSRPKFSILTIEAAISLNPQLRGIGLYNPTPQDLHFLNRKLPELEKLTIGIRLSDFDGAEKIRFEKVKQLILTIDDKNVKRTQLELPFVCDELEELELRTFNRHLTNLNWPTRSNNLKKINIVALK